MMNPFSQPSSRIGMIVKPSLLVRLVAVAGIGLAFLSGCASGGPEVGTAETALEEGNYESALASLEQAVERDSANIRAYEMKASVLRRMADSNMTPENYTDLYRRAQAAEDSILRYRPGRENEVQARRLELYRREVDRGERAYNRANKLERRVLYRRAMAFFGAAGVLQADSARPVLNEAYARMQFGQRTEVIPVLEEYVKRADTFALEAAKILGQLYLSTGNHEDATELLDRATLFYPDSPVLQTVRLKAYNQAGNVDEALLAYREQIEKKPERAGYRYQYGSLLLKAVRYTDAIRELEKAVELRPQHAESQYNLGAAYLNAALARDDSISTLRERMDAGDIATGEEVADSVLTPAQRIDRLRQRRYTLFEKAVPPLERARKMTETAQLRQDACRALFVAYMRTKRPTKAAQAENCTGFTNVGRK
jgi:tetratricopeptide (TPR) repeat protein